MTAGLISCVSLRLHVQDGYDSGGSPKAAGSRLGRGGVLRQTAVLSLLVEFSQLSFNHFATVEGVTQSGSSRVPERSRADHSTSHRTASANRLVGPWKSRVGTSVGGKPVGQ